jgi:hypothetical protein
MVLYGWKGIKIVIENCIRTHDDEWLKWRVYGVYCRARNPRIGEYI